MQDTSVPFAVSARKRMALSGRRSRGRVAAVARLTRRVKIFLGSAAAEGGGCRSTARLRSGGYAGPPRSEERSLFFDGGGLGAGAVQPSAQGASTRGLPGESQLGGGEEFGDLESMADSGRRGGRGY